MKNCGQAATSRLTEENLRLHSSAHGKDNKTTVSVEEAMWAPASGFYYQFNDDLDDYDEDLDTGRNNVALRRAASLEALQAYGGCFASGFFALQNPHPWTRRPWYEDVEGVDVGELIWELAPAETISGRASSWTTGSRAGSPRPDSDTLSHADVQELRNSRKWSWRFVGRRRRRATKKPE